MEWVWQLLDNIQKSHVFEKLQSLAPFDWCMLFALLFGISYGSRQGVSNMFSHVLSLLLTGLVAMSFYEKGAAVLNDRAYFIPLEAAKPIIFFLTSVFVWVSSAWLFSLVGKFARIEISGILKPIGGMFLGAFHFILLMSLIVQFFLFFPAESIQKIFKSGQTYSGYAISRVLPDLYRMIVMPKEEPSASIPVRKTFKTRQAN
ncbi:MAG TPA: CvpA family protein [Candidatus Omnitrophota bacterium]|nr:CvpA family protein [Candidatus Omnitrophota bacterium]